MVSNRQRTLPEIDHTSVTQYWESVKSSILGPYMMDNFGFPVSAGDFRFRTEAKVVRRILRNETLNGTVLDLGSGVGYWAEEFAHRFSQVVAVEGSQALYVALKERCAPYSNICTLHGDVMSFEPKGLYSMVYFGGLLMYLDQHKVIALLQKLIPHLEPNGVILCRESTVRGKTITRTGNYPVVYRTVQDYGRLFTQSRLTLQHMERNEPYVLTQMGCELIAKWKRVVPEQFQALRIVGRLAYWAMRLGYPWITHLPKILRIPYPYLENHFFMLRTQPMVPQ
ncbi:MAG: class I SAM-dependent methyltransferase [Nitrospirota bacterium]|nr:class I SAM-dependent methyltransferase [Nitrospirota bacterium]